MSTPNDPKWAEKLAIFTKALREVAKTVILVSIVLSHVGVLEPIGDTETIGKVLELIG